MNTGFLKPGDRQGAMNAARTWIMNNRPSPKASPSPTMMGPGLVTGVREPELWLCTYGARALESTVGVRKTTLHELPGTAKAQKVHLLHVSWLLDLPNLVNNTLTKGFCGLGVGDIKATIDALGSGAMIPFGSGVIVSDRTHRWYNGTSNAQLIDPGKGQFSCRIEIPIAPDGKYYLTSSVLGEANEDQTMGFSFSVQLEVTGFKSSSPVFGEGKISSSEISEGKEFSDPTSFDIPTESVAYRGNRME